MNVLQAMFQIFIFPGFVFLFVSALFFHWLDRKLIARFQGRIGPPWYQPLADFLKLFAKEDVLPQGTNLLFASLLPLVSFASVLTASFYLPVAVLTAPSFQGDLIVVLFLLSMPSLLYFLAGWITGGVYSILGGIRSLLQYFSYEIPFLLAVSGTAIASGSWSLADIRAAQLSSGAYIIPQWFGFLLAVSGLIGKLKREPYDIPKAQSEMVAGPLTEFSGKKLGLWYLTNHLQTVVGLAFLVNVYFAGYWEMNTLGGFIICYLLLILLQCLLSAISAIYARLRIDQLISLNWRVLIPLTLLHNLFLLLK
ncbi:MAG TPA: NADH-quinone oxidoreductase subunit H [Anaerolineaceae bacterium]|jgi:NADH-quinone oxidoreductase subunit H|nr:NADH-quinone oxidoreductase subunit H [Anaerolineaceae bacterium]